MRVSGNVFLTRAVLSVLAILSTEGPDSEQHLEGRVLHLAQQWSLAQLCILLSSSSSSAVPPIQISLDSSSECLDEIVKSVQRVCEHVRMWPLAPAESVKPHVHLASRQREITLVLGSALASIHSLQHLALPHEVSTISSNRSQSSISASAPKNVSADTTATSLDVSTLDTVQDRLCVSPSTCRLDRLLKVFWDAAQTVATITLPPLRQLQCGGHMAAATQLSASSQRAVDDELVMSGGVPWEERVHPSLQQSVLEACESRVPGDGLEYQVPSQRLCAAAAADLMLVYPTALFNALAYVLSALVAGVNSAASRCREMGQCEQLRHILSSCSETAEELVLLQQLRTAASTHEQVCMQSCQFLVAFLTNQAYNCSLDRLIPAAFVLRLMGASSHSSKLQVLCGHEPEALKSFMDYSSSGSDSPLYDLSALQEAAECLKDSSESTLLALSLWLQADTFATGARQHARFISSKEMAHLVLLAAALEAVHGLRSKPAPHTGGVLAANSPAEAWLSECLGLLCRAAGHEQ